MKKKYSLTSYLFKLKKSIIAPKLISVLHGLSQIALLAFALFFIFSQMQKGEGNYYAIIVIIAGMILLPLASFLVRAWFELVMVPFAISKNVHKIKKILKEREECGC